MKVKGKVEGQLYEQGRRIGGSKEGSVRDDEEGKDKAQARMPDWDARLQGSAT
jgi:hypothetical protein